MIRRLLRGLRRPPASPPEDPPAAPDARFIDAAGLRARRDDPPLCLDLRPVSALRYGFVEGAWLLPDLKVVPPTSRRVIVLAEDPEAAADCGHLVTWGGLGAWRSAGFAIRDPEWKAPLPLLHPVTVSGVPGWIQDVGWSGVEFVFAVLLQDGRRLTGLTEEEIASRGPRGAAGLGEQL